LRAWQEHANFLGMGVFSNIADTLLRHSTQARTALDPYPLFDEVGEMNPAIRSSGRVPLAALARLVT